MHVLIHVARVGRPLTSAGRVDRQSHKPVSLGAAGRPAVDPEDVQVVLNAHESLFRSLQRLLVASRTRTRRRRRHGSLSVAGGRVREAARQRARGSRHVRRGRRARALAGATARPARRARRLAAGRHSRTPNWSEM